jgi:hypothetical protein
MGEGVRLGRRRSGAELSPRVFPPSSGDRRTHMSAPDIFMSPTARGCSLPSAKMATGAPSGRSADTLPPAEVTPGHITSAPLKTNLMAPLSTRTEAIMFGSARGEVDERGVRGRGGSSGETGGAQTPPFARRTLVQQPHGREEGPVAEAEEDGLPVDGDEGGLVLAAGRGGGRGEKHERSVRGALKCEHRCSSARTAATTQGRQVSRGGVAAARALLRALAPPPPRRTPPLLTPLPP